MIHKEYILQEKVKEWVAGCVSCPHKFVSHDRSPPRSPFDHAFQAKRGMRADWPDTEIALDGGRTFRCELKRPGINLPEHSGQAELITELNVLGHPSAWANSVKMYGEACDRFGIPLRGNWRTIAQIADEQVIAEIRKQELKKKPANPDAQMVKPRPKAEHQRTPNQIRKFEAVRMRTLPR